MTITASRYWLLFLMTLILMISSSSATTRNLTNSSMEENKDVSVAIEEMQKANYYTFVMLLNMVPPDLFLSNLTFLMPNDRTLSKANFSDGATSSAVVDFLLLHSIPSPLLIDHLRRFPTGSMIPTSRPGFMLKVTNDGWRRFFLNNVRITSPNICTSNLSSVRCHGIDGVVEPTDPPKTTTPSPGTCPYNNNNNSSTPPMPEAPLPAPSPPARGFNPAVPVTALPPSHVIDVGSAQKSSGSPRAGIRGEVDLAIKIFISIMLNSWVTYYTLFVCLI